MTILLVVIVLLLLAYHSWMKDNGGSIVNIIADMFKGFPGMA